MKKLFAAVSIVLLSTISAAQEMESVWADSIIISFGNISDPRHALGPSDGLAAIFPAHSSQMDIGFTKDSLPLLKSIRKNATLTIYVLGDESVDSTGGTLIMIKTDMFGAIEYQSSPYLLRPGINTIYVTDQDYTYLSLFPTDGAKSFLLDAVMLYQEKDTGKINVRLDNYASGVSVNGVYPNPIPAGSNFQTVLSYELDRNADVSIVIRDGRGSVVQSETIHSPSGLNETVLSVPTAGWYLVTMIVDGLPVRKTLKIAAQ
jgi:hypothetical protein